MLKTYVWGTVTNPVGPRNTAYRSVNSVIYRKEPKIFSYIVEICIFTLSEDLYINKKGPSISYISKNSCLYILVRKGVVITCTYTLYIQTHKKSPPEIFVQRGIFILISIFKFRVKF